MLLAVVIVLAVVIWGAIGFLYYKEPIVSYFDNRFGPERLEKKPEKPPKKRMYE